ncbi:MAG: succinate dehydrogenase / fumarate reductase, iron-sulfur subunit [Frankiaceae bacterium]|nr:succinate dehydrogenase / fumarate reductase, iron-sulfur subunit [Frankiaceae bacterium]
MGHQQSMRVWRGDASGGDFRSYSVPVEEGEVVLDAIHRLQAEQAPDLAVRWNCKAGKCGSCSAEINGKPALMCMTRLSTFEPTETVTVTPMRAFPVIRDLVTDVTFNYEKAREVPAFAPPHSNADGSFRMQQVDVERGQEFRKCIECFLCQNTCHVIRDHEENKPAFAGPRFFIRYAELDMHPLDTLDRRRMAQEDEGLGYCNITKCCSEVCPEGIHITDNGIIPLKERVVDTKYDPVFISLGIGRRKQRRLVGPGGGSGPSPIKRPGQGQSSLRSAASAGPASGATATPTFAPAPPRAPTAVDKVASTASSAASKVGTAANAESMKTAMPAIGAAVGVGFLAWAIRKTRKK